MSSNRRTSCRARQWTAGAGLAAAAAMIGMGTAHADTPSDVLAAGVDPNDALVLIPAENQLYADVANALYLQPSGFDGAATVFITPDVGNEVQNVVPGVQALVQTIEADYTANDLSAADPLYVFGYSEGAVEEGLAEPQLAAFGIPTDDLHFVMVGDSASAEGGFLNTVISSLPESEQQSTTELFAQLGLTAPVLGATTPDNLYPTDAYSLTTDGWTNWADGANTYGMFTDHLEYLGLTPAEVATATETTDGLTHYFTIDDTNVNDLAALYNQALLALDITPSNVTIDAAGAAADAAPTAATPADLLSDATTNYTDASQLLSAIPSGSVGEYAPALASATEFDGNMLQGIANLDSAESALSSYDNGILSEFLTPVFTNIDQSWDQASEAALSSTQALDGVVGSGSTADIAAGLLAVSTSEFEALQPAIQAEFIDLGAHFLTGGDFTSFADLGAGLDPVSAIDPSMFADLLSSIGL
jgi:PE-PPE domain